MNKPLLRKIKKAILEEPRRIRMSGWFLSMGQLANHERPECGTVGCIAAWACILGGAAKNSAGLARLGRSDIKRGIEARAVELLDLDSEQTKSLFYAGNWPWEFWNELQTHAYGTAKYAKIVADYLDFFMQKD